MFIQIALLSELFLTLVGWTNKRSVIRVHP